LAGFTRKRSATVRSALRVDDAGLVQGGELMLEEAQGYALRRRDRARRNRTVAVARGKLDQGTKTVFGAERELHQASENGLLPGKMVAVGGGVVNGHRRRQG